MAEIDIGYFGDERLKKMAPDCLPAYASGKRFVCASWGTTEPKRSSFGVF